MWEGFEGSARLVYVPDCSAVDSARSRHPVVLDERTEFAFRNPDRRRFNFSDPEYNWQKWQDGDSTRLIFHSVHWPRVKLLISVPDFAPNLDSPERALAEKAAKARHLLGC
jgi:hypothetical protein